MHPFRFFCFLLFAFTPSLSQGQISGCTDPLATNYNALANTNDGTCTYPATSVTAAQSTTLAGSLDANSALLDYDSSYWTIIDLLATNLYRLQYTGSISQTCPLNGVQNINWEELAQDSLYFYIGDFGNNLNGNRTNLQILRITKNSLCTGNEVIDTIRFSYSDQTNFSPTGINNTDFDCEAFIVRGDSIFLFTKQWLSGGTSIYSFPKTPGIYVAQKQTSLSSIGLITGATHLENRNCIVLSGYSTLLQPFLVLLYDFSHTAFFSGNKRILSLNLPFHQVEGITSRDGLLYSLSNERLLSPFNVAPKLHTLDLSPYLLNYLTTGLSQATSGKIRDYSLSPNPGKSEVTITFPQPSLQYQILNLQSLEIAAGSCSESPCIINTHTLNAGRYFIVLSDERGKFLHKLSFIKAE